MGDSSVAAATALGQCLPPHVCRELSKRSFNFSVQRSARVRVWFMSLICGGIGSAEAIFTGLLTVDVTAPPPARVAAPRSFTLASRRVRRKTSKAGGGDEGSEWFSDDGGGDFGNFGGVYGSGGGGDSRGGGGMGGMARIGVQVGTRLVIRPSILSTGLPVGSLCRIACIMLSRRRSASFKMMWITGSLIENPLIKGLYKLCTCKY